MSTSHNQRGTTPTPTKSSPVVLLLGTIADTTWRMFVPLIGLTILGVMGDNSFHTKPWCTTLGIVLGAIIATLLVLRQLRNTKPE